MIKKFLIIVLSSFFIIFSIGFYNTDVYAASSLDSIISDADSFIARGSKKDVVDNAGLKKLSDNTYSTLMLVGMVIAVVVGTILGIQFMLSSVEQKAKVKEILIVYFVGCAVLISAFTIWKIVINIMK